MAEKLILFSILVLVSALADSFLHNVEGFGVGAYQTEWPSVHRSHSQRINNYGNNQHNNAHQRQFQSGQWPSGQQLSQHSNFQRPKIINNPPNSYKHNNQLSQKTYSVSQGLQQTGPETQSIDFNNFARSPNTYNQPQNFDNVKGQLQSGDISNSVKLQNNQPRLIKSDVRPNDRKLSPQHQASAHQNINSGPAEQSWIDQTFSNKQQSNTLNKPSASGTFTNYPGQQGKSYGIYDQGYPQYQMPVESFNSYGQRWPPQNQYNAMTIPYIEYVPWPIPAYQSTPSNDLRLPQIDPIPNENNSPPFPAYDPVATNNPASDAGPIIVSPGSGPVYQDDIKPILPSQQPLKEHDNNIPLNKRYIIVHVNGTYEHVDNLNDIEVDEFDIAHIKSKELPNHVLAIIEVEDIASDTEHQKPLNYPYDTGISMIPKDTDWNLNDQDYPGLSQNSYSVAGSTLPVESVANIETTTEDTTNDYIRNYFKPEFLMPIEYTTVNSNTATDTPRHNPTEMYENVNHFDNYFTPNIADVHPWNSNDNKESSNHFEVELIIPITEQNINTNSEITTDINKNYDFGNFHTSETTSIPYLAHSFNQDNKYFYPEYIMPIQSTENSIHSITDTSRLATDINKGTNSNENIFDNSDTTHTADISHWKLKNEDSTNYIKPEFITSTHSTTANSVDTTTELSHQTKDTYGTTDSNENDPNTTQTANIPKGIKQYKDADISQDDVEVVIVAFIEPSHEGSEYDRSIYYGPLSTSEEPLPSETESENSATNGMETSIANGDDAEPDSILKSKPSSPLDASPNVSDGSSDSSESSPYPAKTDNVDEKPSASAKLRKDLEVDPGSLKTVIGDKPVVWFRPDKDFWEKVTKEDQAYDAVTLYDVKCQPKLIERYTTIHHYANGTEAEEYVETIWDYPGDLNPKQVNSNRVVRYPQNQ